jgi:hypothetical protein
MVWDLILFHDLAAAAASSRVPNFCPNAAKNVTLS